MAIIYSPNKDYTGISAGVVFEKGVGETSDPYLLTWFEQNGYTVEKMGQAAPVRGVRNAK